MDEADGQGFTLLLGEPGLERPRALDGAVPFGVDVVAYTARSPLKDTANEDGLGICLQAEHLGVLAVADGIGGHAAGEQASRAALEALHAATRDAAARGVDLRGAVLDGLDQADARIRALGLGAGTTICVAILDGAGLRTVHVGDSAALLCGQRGRLKHVTLSHSPVGYGVEAGLIDEADAMTHADRHLISNAVGLGDMKVEIGPAFALAPRDTLVLASDGLWDNLRITEVVELVRRGPLLRAAEELCQRAAQRMAGGDPELHGKPDDLSFVLLRRRVVRRPPSPPPA